MNEHGEANLLPLERVEARILLLRGQKVLLDADLAELYGVATKALNQAVKRNEERFPDDFMFQLNELELNVILRSPVVTSNVKSVRSSANESGLLRSQIVTSKRGASAGGRRYLPYAFTEQGIAMLSSVLRSPRAIAVNIEIMRAFVRLRQMIASHADLARKLRQLEKKYDAQFKAVFDAIHELMSPDAVPPEREIGFHASLKEKAEGLKG